MKYTCNRCCFVAETVSLCRAHMNSEHPSWDKSNSTSSADQDVSDSMEPSAKRATVNNKPDWCRELKSDFKSLVVSNCCQRTKDAVEKNEVIKVGLLVVYFGLYNFVFRIQNCGNTLKMSLSTPLLDIWRVFLEVLAAQVIIECFNATF